ncbi:DUF3231 family protein [Halobacillus aidingensis]|uniref:DUF3231 family protein n=1 Tax=Halobacillus aidingensis TaxID=240303 RepID=A0A1H0UCQ7_HALAD|nr:DUF3231 family protein [Halobacillus aidingensis]SDP63923.1 Protein of unknown function [Halobacillus aidingensis]
MDKNNTSFQVEKKIMEQVREQQQNTKLAASEIGDLFANYLGDSLFDCVFKHHLQVVEDDEIRDFIVFASNISQKHLKIIKDIYREEDIPVPVGFGEQDVRYEAPKLFSDLFMVFYITEMSRAGLLKYGDALSTASRHDVVDYIDMCIQDTINTYKYGTYLLLAKGMDITTPSIPYPEKVDFVENQSFISFIAGKQRPITALEIKHLQVNITTNTLGKALMTAFSQVASSDNLRKYFREGSSLAEGQIKQLGELLLSENLPSPKLMDTHVTDSTTSPFSDKLLMYHTVLSNGIGIKNYGTAISEIMRHDIHAKFATLSAGIAKYANQGMKIMINHGWLEEPPTAADRKKLSKESPDNSRNGGS